MQGLPEFPDGYFERFSTDPVTLVPFDPATRQVAAKAVDQIEKLLTPFEVTFEHKGSTRFAISGKGDIEIGVYPAEASWAGVLARLESRLGPPGRREEDYARYNEICEGFEIEITVLKGRNASDFSASPWFLR